MMELAQQSATAAAEALAVGRMSCAQYAAALLARVTELEPRIQAWAWLSPERAAAQAADRDQTLRTRGKTMRLHGIPVGVKDIIDTAGIPTELGSVVYRGRTPTVSAAVVERLEQAGAYVFGKTVTAELAYFFPGPTRNPWNPAHTPGGSSSGSAAAVAAGVVPLALGTQTNGSVIRPAAYCGVIGFKPSGGLISRYGIQPFSATLDQVGVFARTLDDAEMFAACLSAQDARDPASRAAPEAFARVPLSEPPRLAIVRSPVWHLAEAAQQQALLEAAGRLDAAGARVEETDLPDAFAQAHACHRVIMDYEGSRTFAALQQQHRSQLSAPLNQLIDRGREIDEPTYRRALQLRALLQEELERLLTRYNAILTPPATGAAPRTLTHTGDPTFCTLWTLCAVPALTFPCGLGPANLPLGLQLVGGGRRDAKLLAVARWCIRHFPFSYDHIDRKPTPVME